MNRNIEIFDRALTYGLGYGFGTGSFMAGLFSVAMFFALSKLIDAIKAVLVKS